MKRIASLLLLAALCGCAGGGPAAPDPAIASTADPSTPASDPVAAVAVPTAIADAFVLPGTFSEATTVDDLRARFGAGNVAVTGSPQDDGSVRRSVVLFAADPTRRAYVDFHDPGTLAGLANIAVRDAGSRWRGKGGVRVGMSFADLRRINGRPFLFSGFDEEGRAWVRDAWSPALDDVGGPGALDVGDGEHMYFGVDLGLREAAGALAPGTVPHDEYSASSDDPRWPQLGEIAEVTAISAYTSLDDEWE